MIRNEKDYQEARARLKAEQDRLAEYAAAWRKQGHDDDAVKRLLEPLQSFHLQLAEEVEGYERLKQGRFSEMENLQGMGQLLIGLRIFRGMTQRQLAEKLNVDESAVSRDERNEYQGITVERAEKILEALGARLRSAVQIPEFPTFSAESRDEPVTA